MVRQIVPILAAEGYSFARVDQVKLQAHADVAPAEQAGAAPGSAPAPGPCR
jgi:hypothetical protein